LANYLHGTLLFNQVAQGEVGGIEYWTGLAVMNDFGTPVDLTLDVFRPDGAIERSVQMTLRPFQHIAMLLSELLGEPDYRHLNGYMRLRASEPVSAIVMYGDSRNRFLSAVPGEPH
jgi:hypothetical protein